MSECGEWAAWRHAKIRFALAQTIPRRTPAYIGDVASALRSGKLNNSIALS